MPARSNPRHEFFCQNVAAGLSGAKALRQAGGGGTTAANGAYRLQQLPEVKARIDKPKQAIAALEVAQQRGDDRQWPGGSGRCPS